MSGEAPRLDTRRTAEFAAELQERARAWIPNWGLADGEGDFGRALLEIAARFNAEVAERVDGAGDKMRRGFLDWLGVRAEAARPARVPVVFKLADAARSAVLAEAPVRLQADAGGTPVVFETERDVRVVPGRVDALVAVDAANDAFYLAPSGLTSLEPVEAAPTRWQPKSFVAAGATRFQLDPEGGLAEGTVIEAAGYQYRVVAVDKDLVTVSPPLDSDLTTDVVVNRADRLEPFGGVARNWQAHALYLGDPELLNIEAGATIEVVGAGALKTGVAWQYWGKVEGADDVAWQRLPLADVQPAGNSVRLRKPRGVVEIKDIAGRSARWIRAYRPASDAVVAAEAFSIRINAVGCPTLPPCAFDDESVPPSAEGMANTTPLVLENMFLPLGREPRQFDAFYLGSKEVFSKPNASVQLCFQMADPKFKALASLRGGLVPDFLFAGVAEDGHLHLLLIDPAGPRLSRFRARVPVRPPSPDVTGAPVGGAPIALDDTVRPAMWLAGTTAAFVAVAAGSDVWLWREDASQSAVAGWRPLGSVGGQASSSPVTGLAHLTSGADGYLLALRDSKLYAFDLNASAGSWRELEVKAGTTSIALTQIASIQVEAQNRGTSFIEGIVGIGTTPSATSSKLYGIKFSASLAGTATELLTNVAKDVTPAAIRRTDNRLVAIAMGKPQGTRKVLAFRSTPAAQSFVLDKKDEAELEWSLKGTSIDVNIVGNEVTGAFCLVHPGAESAIAIWSPLFGSGKTRLFRTRIPAADGASNGAPALLPQFVMVPTTTSEVIIARLDPARRVQHVGQLATAIVAAPTAHRLVAGDYVAFFDGTSPQIPHLEKLQDDGKEVRRQVYHEIQTAAVKSDLLVFKASAPLSGKVRNNLSEIDLDPLDTTTGPDSVLLITTDQPDPKLYKVTNPVGGGMATLDPALQFTTPPAVGDSVTYRRHDESGARLLPMLSLNPAGSWDAAGLDRVQLIFPGAKPVFQDGVAVDFDLAQPKSVALGEFWTAVPPGSPQSVAYVVDESVGPWSHQLADTSTNPELSWEYWNGTGWWTLSATDHTLNLKRTGTVTFRVPDDLRESDWSGKTNFWIRARLIGGDYGQEKVTVITTPLPGGKTEQTVQRSSDGIRPPTVLKLRLAYALCDGAQPAFVLSEDSGSLRDQSDANRTRGAIVEAFVPLSVTLQRLTGDAREEARGTERPPDCTCRDIGPTDCGCKGHRADGAISREADTPSAPGGLALFVGVTAALTEAPVNLLFVVDERRHGELAPLTVEALVAGRLERIVANDDTRAFGESGVVSMSFPDPPGERELFGRTLTWLKLSPRPTATTTTWRPSLRGAYLNAAWASATETLTRELLGSSDGAPFLTVRVARPPLLRDSLELRVREPLGDEERAALVDGDETRVSSHVEGLPGHWVRWDRVTDPGDEPPTARVYALDESTGEVRFGDGLHGMIPPIGRDSIVAFSYKRTEPGPAGSTVVPANGIAARTPLNLVSPVESVESVVAADHAAGGAPPESVERVVRFGFARLRHRRRAVTAKDLEDIALQSSPDIVQARAFQTRSGTKLVVVMKGATPAPTAAQVRELRRVLLDAAPPSLADAGALQISGPGVRRLRVELTLRVESLDRAGALGTSVKEKLAAFFDTATGGLDARGWPLGVSPSEEDIALALVDAPHLDGILDVVLRELDDEGDATPWPPAIPDAHLAMLAADPVRIAYESEEVPA